MHHNEVKLKACNIAQHSWESRPILNGEQPEAVKDYKIALNDPGSIIRAHPTAALSDSDLGLLNYRRLFRLLGTLHGLVSVFWTK